MKQFLKTVVFILVCGGAGAAIVCAGDEDLDQRIWEGALIAATWLLAAILGKIVRQMPDDKPAKPTPAPRRRHPRNDVLNERD